MKSDFLCNRKGEPVFLCGLQCHNSSVGTEMMDRTIQAIRLYGGNLLEAPVYWCEIEKEQDVYDMSSVAELVDKAEAAGLYLLPLWFGASKNGLYTYAPDYIKTNPKVYKRARNSEGLPVESLSPHCPETRIRDQKAFVKVLEFLEAYDKKGTVIALQVENEMGLVHTDRDYSREARELFEKPVPENLRTVVLEDCGLSEEERKAGNENPTWHSLFGRWANEAFCAWGHASYVQELVKAGREKTALPFLMNVSIEINQFEEPAFCYVAGGPVSRVVEIWKRTAPGIRLFGPDIYLSAERDFRKACEAYSGKGFPLFIPESMHGGVGPAMNMLIAAADYEAIGFCCFGAESGIENGRLLPEAEHTALSMRILSSLSSLLVRYHGTGRIHAVTQAEFSPWQYVKTPDYHITAYFISSNENLQHYYGSRFNMNAPENRWMMEERGRCVIIDCGDGEFYAAGVGVCLSFLRRPEVQDPIPYAHVSSAVSGQLNFLSVEEGHFEGEKWVCEYKRNGDEANYLLYIHPGTVVRIRLNKEMAWKEEELC